MRDKHKSRWLRSCRLGLSAMALGASGVDGQNAER